MLNNTITLGVDILNSGVTTDIDFIRFDETQNRTTYISENHEPGVRDILNFYRTLPKVIGNFKGVRKTALKFTRDYSVPTVDGGTTQSPAIIEVSFSLPVGLSAADTLECRQRTVALLDLDAVMNDFNNIQVI